MTQLLTIEDLVKYCAEKVMGWTRVGRCGCWHDELDECTPHKADKWNCVWPPSCKRKWIPALSADRTAGHFRPMDGQAELFRPLEGDTRGTRVTPRLPACPRNGGGRSGARTQAGSQSIAMIQPIGFDYSAFGAHDMRMRAAQMFSALKVETTMTRNEIVEKAVEADDYTCPLTVCLTREGTPVLPDHPEAFTVLRYGGETMSKAVAEELGLPALCGEVPAPETPAVVEEPTVATQFRVAVQSVAPATL